MSLALIAVATQVQVFQVGKARNMKPVGSANTRPLGI